jgi:hypothetical protein
MATAPVLAPVDLDEQIQVTTEPPVRRTGSEPQQALLRDRPRTSVGARLVDAAIYVVGTPVYVAACVLGAIGQAVGGVVALAVDRRHARRYRAYPAS